MSGLRSGCLDSDDVKFVRYDLVPQFEHVSHAPAVRPWFARGQGYRGVYDNKGRAPVRVRVRVRFWGRIKVRVDVKVRERNR